MRDSATSIRQHNPLNQLKTVKRMAELLILFVTVSFISCSFAEEDSLNFKAQPFEIADFGLFDLGVVDMNNDDRLDIFTANHSGPQSLLLNNGSGKFTDVYALWKMDQDHQFPGLAV